jgi:hypothetical protein
MVFGVVHWYHGFTMVHLYFGNQLYSDLLWHKCTAPKTLVHFILVHLSMVVTWWHCHGKCSMVFRVVHWYHSYQLHHDKYGTNIPPHKS